jgi:hypothetical protein
MEEADIKEMLAMKAFGPKELLSDDSDDEALIRNKERCNRLHDDRIMSGERNFLEVCEKNDFEKLNTWKARNSCSKFCWKVKWCWFKVKQYSKFIIDHPLFDALVILLILTNSITLAMNDPTIAEADTPSWSKTLSLVYLVLYSVEMTLKILGLGFFFGQGSYLSDAWNVLDFIIVVSGYLELLSEGSGVSLSALRVLRVLRPLRTISSIRNLKTIIITIFNAVPYLTEVGVVVIFVWLVFAIAGLQLFSGLLKRRCFDEGSGVTFNYRGDEILCNGTDSCPGGFICGKQRANPAYGVTNFDNLGSSFLMVFQVTTMEGWT